MKVSFSVNNWSTVRLTDGQVFYLLPYRWCAFGKFLDFNVIDLMTQVRILKYKMKFLRNPIELRVTFALQN